VVVAAARDAVADARGGRGPAPDNWAEEIADRVARRLTPSLQPVLNATGVVLHTNLGRAPLARRAIEAVARVAAGYSTLEFDLDRSAAAGRIIAARRGARRSRGRAGGFRQPRRVRAQRSAEVAR
jgi:L-seryl-tRNA(Ser) seleniumtransferase